MSNRLGGNFLPYRGTAADAPPNWQFNDRNPSVYDIHYSIGDLWLNEVTFEKWVLVSLQNPGGGVPRGDYATWVPWGAAGAGLVALTTPLPVPGFVVTGDGAAHINLLTTIANLTITGVDVPPPAPGHSVEFSLVGGGNILKQITGGGGGVASADAAGNITINSAIAGVQFTGAGSTITLDWTGGAPAIVRTLSGDAGVFVSPNAGGNIQIMSTIPGLTVVENPLGPNLALTSASGGGYIEAVVLDDAHVTIPDAFGHIGFLGGENITTYWDTINPEIMYARVSGITPNAMVYGSATGGLVSTAALTDGQVLVGSTGNPPLLRTITGGAGIDVTFPDGPDRVLITNTAMAGMAWSVINNVGQAMAPNNGYISNNPGVQNYTLPAAPVLGNQYVVTSENATGSWLIHLNAGQQIIYGNELTAVGGTLSSTQVGDAVELVCIDATPGAEKFQVLDSVGDLGSAYISGATTNNAWNSNSFAEVAKGGTGRNTLTDHAVLLGSGTAPVDFAVPGLVAGIPLVSAVGPGPVLADPVFGTAAVAGGGTGTNTFAPNSVIISNAAGNVLTTTSSAGIPAGYVLTYNGIPGTPTAPTWQPGGITTSTYCAFLATITPSILNVTGDGTYYTVPFNVEYYDVHNDYNNATGIFTAPVTGKYHFDVHICAGGFTAINQGLSVFLYTSKRNYLGDSRWSQDFGGDTPEVYFSAPFDVDLDVGQTAQVVIWCAGLGKIIHLDQRDAWDRNYFSGHLISNTAAVDPATLCSFSGRKWDRDWHVTGDSNVFSVGSGNLFAILFNIGGGFNANGIFTAPYSGYYQINVQVNYQVQNGGALSGHVWADSTPALYVVDCSRFVTKNFVPNLQPPDDIWNCTGSGIIYLNAGNQVQIKVEGDGGARNDNVWTTYFSGFLVHV